MRQHIDQQYAQISAALASTQREAQIIHASSEKAIEKSEVSMEKRFEGVNAFRDQLQDQAATFMPRELAESQAAALNARINELAEKVGKIV